MLKKKNNGSIPLHMFINLVFLKNIKLKDRKFYKSTINTPIYYDLNIKSQMYIIKSIYQF